MLFVNHKAEQIAEHDYTHPKIQTNTQTLAYKHRNLKYK